eukprot:9064472-Pyramimonas_sp.AAC.1
MEASQRGLSPQGASKALPTSSAVRMSAAAMRYQHSRMPASKLGGCGSSKLQSTWARGRREQGHRV